MTPETVPRPEICAGGTDLSERRRSGVSQGAIVDLQPTRAMTEIVWNVSGAVSLGAAVTIEAVAADPVIGRAYPGLSAAAGGLATPQIRAVATVGGNIAQRSRCWYFRNPHFSCLKKHGSACPARTGNHRYGVVFDLGPCVAPHPSTLGAALIAYEARVTTDRRTDLPMALFFGDGSDGSADNSLADGERILSIDLLQPVAGERAVYRRAISRTHAEWPLAEAVIRIVPEGERIAFARVGIGGVAPVPLRLTEVEDVLLRRRFDETCIAAASSTAGQGATPLPMTRFKVALLEGLIADLLERLRSAAQQAG
jgi:xanthine dehydrogenase YagS FAD-binding subunit